MKRGARPAAERASAPAVRAVGGVRSPEGVANARLRDAARYRAMRAVARMHRDEYVAVYSALPVDPERRRDRDCTLRRQAAWRTVARNHPEDYARALAAEKRRGGAS